MITNARRLLWVSVAGFAISASLGAFAQNDKPSDDPKRPKLTLRKSSTIATSPARKSEIQRIFPVEHVFLSGDYHVTFRLRRRDKDLTTVSADLRIQPSLNEIGEPSAAPRPGGGPH